VLGPDLDPLTRKMEYNVAVDDESRHASDATALLMSIRRQANAPWAAPVFG